MKAPKGMGGVKAVPSPVCPSCKFHNELGTLTCKKCGEFLTSGKGKGVGEYDATEGAFHPGCVVVPVILILGALIFFFMSISRAPKEGTCDYNKARIGRAVVRYNLANPSSKMTTLNLDTLINTKIKNKSLMKDRPKCPVESSARYEVDSEGRITCSNCK